MLEMPFSDATANSRLAQHKTPSFTIASAGDREALQAKVHEELSWFPQIEYQPFDKMASEELDTLFEALVQHLTVAHTDDMTRVLLDCKDLTKHSQCRGIAAMRTLQRQQQQLRDQDQRLEQQQLQQVHVEGPPAQRQAGQGAEDGPQQHRTDP
jgi:hypothetical protein